MAQLDAPIFSERVEVLREAPLRPEAAYVLYWMTAFRRRPYNHALQRAVTWARELNKPLLILEPLRLGYPWASERLHRFIIEGMAANGRAFAGAPVRYYPYLETTLGDGQGLVAALGKEACVVVGDEYPCFFLPRMQRAAAAALQVRFEVIDGNGALPLRAAPKVFARAVDLRRFLQRTLPERLLPFPQRDALAKVSLPKLGALPRQVTQRWPAASAEELEEPRLESLALDHGVGAVSGSVGGHEEARQRLEAFLDHGLPRYGERNQPEVPASSGLSPYLHFGHIGVHEVLDALFEVEEWSVDRIAAGASTARGQREGYWGLSPAAEGFIDELLTWRELGFNFCHHRPDDYHRYDSLPSWALKTLEDHAGDPRAHRYDLARLDAAETHDPLWNAAQRQLRREGVIHNYLRMLWGKKILEWSAHPREALEVMLELNNRYALDGRDPNSYSGIFWVLGRYDRAWGPERPIFGKVRYMSSENTARKLRMAGYLQRYG